MKLLSIDWDWVVGDTSGEIYNCCGMCEHPWWSGRGRGVSKKCRKDWRERFERLKSLEVVKNTPISVAECHGSIGEVFKQYDNPVVVDFDTHYDFYNRWDYINCANWIYHLKNYGGDYFTYEQICPDNPNAIFLCLSSPWTPKEMDKYFYELIWYLAYFSNTQPKFIGHRKKSMRKTYNKQTFVEEICLT